MQILAVRKENKNASMCATLERAKRIAITQPDKFDLFELRFGRSTKPVLKPIKVTMIERTKPEAVFTDTDGNEIE